MSCRYCTCADCSFDDTGAIRYPIGEASPEEAITIPRDLHDRLILAVLHAKHAAEQLARFLERTLPARPPRCPVCQDTGDLNLNQHERIWDRCPCTEEGGVNYD